MRIDANLYSLKIRYQPVYVYDPVTTNVFESLSFPIWATLIPFSVSKLWTNEYISLKNGEHCKWKENGFGNREVNLLVVEFSASAHRVDVESGGLGFHHITLEVHRWTIVIFGNQMDIFLAGKFAEILGDWLLCFRSRSQCDECNTNNDLKRNKKKVE